MNDPYLNKLLKKLRLREAPDLPSSFSRDVLREIRLRGSRPSAPFSWFGELVIAWFRPQTIALALSVAVVVGTIAPVTVGTSNSSQAAIRGLDLDVFSSIAPNSPSGLLAKLP